MAVNWSVVGPLLGGIAAFGVITTGYRLFAENYSKSAQEPVAQPTVGARRKSRRSKGKRHSTMRS